MARVEDGSQTDAGSEIAHHDRVHIIIDNVAYCPEIYRVDDFIVTIIFIPVQVLGLATMA